jgi:hypothetical protein
MSSSKVRNTGKLKKIIAILAGFGNRRRVTAPVDSIF